MMENKKSSVKYSDIQWDGGAETELTATDFPVL